MTKHTSVTVKNAVNRILERAAITADPIIDRSPEQKAIRVECMKAELFEYGLCVVSTEWLKAVLAENPVAGLPRKASAE